MSIELPDVAVTEFASEVHATFQSDGFLLKDGVRLRENVIGETVQFPVAGAGIAKQKSLQADVVPMNISWTPVTMNLQDWYASEYTDIFAQAEVNFDERMELVKACAYAIGRRMDQLIIDALDASGTANTVAVGTTNFTYAKLREGIELLHEDNAGRNGMWCATSASGEGQLLSETELTSSDFVNQRVIENGGLDGLKLAGVNWRVIGSMSEGGLPLTGNNRTCYLWDKMSVGAAIGRVFNTEINYVPEKLSHLVTSTLKSNAVAIDALGICTITIDESA